MRRVAAILVVSTASISIPAIIAILILVVMFLRGPGLTYQNLPFPVSPPVVVAGDTVGISVSLCYDGTGPQSYSIGAYLLNVDTSERTALPPIYSSTLSGCGTITDRVPIPTKLMPGHYSMQGSALIPWAFGTEQVPWQTQVFEVVS